MAPPPEDIEQRDDEDASAPQSAGKDSVSKSQGKSDQPQDDSERKKRRTPRSSRMDNQHGSAKMKVYPITEASIRSLKANSKNASYQSAVGSSMLSIAISILVSYFFTSDPTPFMKALAFIAPILCAIGAGAQFLGARSLREIVFDEWDKIEKNTKFVEIGVDAEE